ncbi:hypothetical protein AB6A40_002729 [Gnathostoma spinigerum]|uniref:Ubiquitin-like modifier-activating enzyme ATG7 n=1 Tax=Gnathostoma spinigerum TaxID=75299 RepID=A0ABD6EI92_9BILA
MSNARFVPFVLFADPSFWSEFNRKKLTEWKLDESQRTVVASYCNSDSSLSCSRLSLSYDAFSTNEATHSCENITYVHGSVIPLNTIEKFNTFNHRQLIDELCLKLKNIIESKRWLTDPQELDLFVLVAFGDLKKFNYHYWNCMPALVFPPDIVFTEAKDDICVDLGARISQEFVRNGGKPFLISDNNFLPLSALPVRSDCEKLIVVYRDPSTKSDIPGWPMRNLLAAVSYISEKSRAMTFMCFRSGTSVPTVSLKVTWSRTKDDWRNCSAVGWERHSDGMLAPSSVSLQSAFDPIKLSEQSVQLNLQLIRWRLVPDIDLDRFANQRCLILGSGTLGCNISRALLGWGFKKFTFVDCAPVSFSNPVRQSLFDFSDSLDGGKLKSVAAASAIKRIYPSVEADAVNMIIPMPGHSFSEKGVEELSDRLRVLEELIIKHDVIFMVMDSREARWAPTVISSYHGKLAISVALGFDSYVVIRHGIRNGSALRDSSVSKAEHCLSHSLRDYTTIPGSELGCYFCSDITAPRNSTKDRTLDQQCTVSRPGLSMAASGMAVELLVSVLQHPLGGLAPAQNGESEEAESCLGSTPHQIRAFISRFSQMTPAVRRFERCVACGVSVLEAFAEHSYSFLQRVVEDPDYLETLCELDKLHVSASQIEMCELDDADDLSSC